jgi:mannose-6-phosphate isomerase class I
VTLPGPVLLRADNFTPPSRTPWGGTRIVSQYKPTHALSAAARTYECVGESWEISVEPDFPSSLEDGTALSTWIAGAPEATLGAEYRPGRAGTALLVKLIDTADPLSVQIHPDNDYAGLAPGECGKPESWYVVAREPGAGLYLGFQSGTRESHVRAALAVPGALRELLRFVPVEPGDFFVIDAGTPHAIGQGLTLVEPQYVVPGLRGVTYRYWDWDRRYDAAGAPSAHGQPRPLHVEHALAVTRFERVQGDDFVSSISLRTGAPDLSARASSTLLCGAGSTLENPYLHVARLSGTGRLALPRWQRLVGLTVVEGTLEVGGLCVERGRSALVPACLSGLEVELSGAHVLVSAAGGEP